MFNYIEMFYNPKRKHVRNGMLSPVVVTIQQKVQATDVKHKIEEALKRNAEIEAQGIRVTVTDTSVRLEGKVNAWHERDVVEKAAWSVPGVQNVVDKLSI